MTAVTSDRSLLDEVDVFSHEVWVKEVPHEQLALLRHEAPVFRHRGTEAEMPPHFWVLTRHADVQAANRDWETFSSALPSSLLSGPQEEVSHDFRTIIDTDPPTHTRLRKLVNRGFMPRVIASYEAHLRDVTAEIFDRALPRGQFDFVVDVAAELPLVAITELLGIPYEDRHRVFEWANRMVGGTDPEYDRGPEARAGAAIELYQYAQELAAQRRTQPQDDIITRLITAVDGDDDKLDDHEFDLFVLTLAVAGSETTRNAMSHGLLALMNNPEQMQALRDAGPQVSEAAVDEILRWATPVSNFRRTATRDVELHGVHIPEGDSVVLSYASANYDETVFADPHQFDVNRSPNPHVSFGGGGVHFCLGSHLARLEIKLLFEELIARTSDIQLDGEVQRLRSSFINGIKHLPVRARPA
jgi:cholest-4-en-3-one 26-monooxygenase